MTGILTPRHRRTPSIYAPLGTCSAVVLTFILLGCSTSRSDPLADHLADAARNIDAVIADPVRASNLRHLIDEVGALLRERAEENAAYRAAWRTLNADYDATPEAFRRLDLDHEARRSDQRERFLALQDRFAAAVSDAEWKRLEDARPATLASQLIEPLGA